MEHNTFIGDGAKGAGGVRIIGEDHTVTANRFENLTGDDERSALCIMLGIPDSVPNGYFQVKRAKVTGNTFINCKHNILIGMAGEKKATLPPLESEISGNHIQTSKAEAFEIKCAAEGVTMKDNETASELSNITQPPAAEPTGPSWKK